MWFFCQTRAAGPGKDVLLGDAGVSAGLSIQVGGGVFDPAGEQGLIGPADPDIDGIGLPAAQPVQQGAVGDFGPHPFDFHQPGPGLGQGQGLELRLGEGAGCHPAGGVQNVAAPPSRPQKGEIRLGERGQTPGGGEGVEVPAVVQRLAQSPAQPVHNPPDPGNVVVLADEEGDEGFKEGLPQHPDAGGAVDAVGQARMGGPHPVQQGGIIQVQGEIAGPEIRVGVGPGQAGEFQAVPGDFPDPDRLSLYNAGPAAVGLGLPAETLAAVQGLGQRQALCLEIQMDDLLGAKAAPVERGKRALPQNFTQSFQQYITSVKGMSAFSANQARIRARK